MEKLKKHFARVKYSNLSRQIQKQEGEEEEEGKVEHPYSELQSNSQSYRSHYVGS